MIRPKKAETIKTANVFLDTEVFVNANFGYNSPRLVSLANLGSSGRLRVFLTNITVREIRQNIRDAVEQAASARAQPIRRNSSLPQVRVRLNPLNAAELERELFQQLDDFVDKTKIEILPVKNKFLGPILEKYFKRLPPFGLGKNKAEFPDALVLEMLKEQCRLSRRGIAVVSRDEGVKAACSENGPLYSFEDLPKFLDTVTSEDKTLSRFIRKMIRRSDDEIFDNAKEVFPELGFYVDDQDGDVNSVELMEIEYDGEVNIISLAADKAIIERPATLTFNAEISYYKPGTGVWDSEDKVLLFQERAEATVTGMAHRSVAVEVAFQDLKTKSFEIRRVWFEGKQDVAVESDKGYPYK